MKHSFHADSDVRTAMSVDLGTRQGSHHRISGVRRPSCRTGRVLCASFSEADPPCAHVIHAGFSLPPCPPRKFPAMRARIRQALAPARAFAGQMSDHADADVDVAGCLGNGAAAGGLTHRISPSQTSVAGDSLAARATRWEATWLGWIRCCERFWCYGRFPACPGGGWVMSAPFTQEPGPVRRAGGDALVLWAEPGTAWRGLPGR